MEKNETLYWTIGGVGIALLALWALNSKGSSTTSGGGGISASALTSEVNNVNNNAAAVAMNETNAQAAYATHASTNAVTVFDTLTNTAAQDLATIEGAQTQRLASNNAMQSSEYAAQQNALTAEAALTASESMSASQNAAAIKIAQTNANAAQQVAQINKPTWWQSLLGAAGSILSAFHFNLGGAPETQGSSTGAIDAGNAYASVLAVPVAPAYTPPVLP